MCSLQAAAERGNAEAAVSLAVSFEQGNFTSVDYSQAVVFYKKFLELKEDEEYTPLPANLCFGWDEHGVQRCHAIKALADLLAEGGNGLTPDLRQVSGLPAPHAPLGPASSRYPTHTCCALFCPIWPSSWYPVSGPQIQLTFA